MARAPHDEESAEARRARLGRKLAPFARDPQDPVESWKESALAQALDAEGRPLHPRVGLELSIGFAVTGMIAGLPFGAGGPALVTLALSSVVLVPELARAAWLRQWGTSSFVIVSAGGAGIETLGPKPAGLKGVLSVLVGPLANLLLAALLGLVSLRLPGAIGATVRTLSFWHAAWGAAQVLPLAPFALGMAIQRRLRGAYAVVHQGFSTKVAILGGLVVAKLFPITFPLVILALSGAVRGFVICYQAAADEKDGIPAQMRQADALVSSGETREALRLAQRALSRARSPDFRARLWKCLAWAAIGQGDAFVAHRSLGTLPRRQLDVHLVASYLAACGRGEEALALLERARAVGQRSRETTKLLLDVLLRRGEMVRARRIAREDRALLTSAEVELLERTIFGPDHETGVPHAETAA
jgi:hypothetical protein